MEALFGEYFRQLRVKTGQSLRAFCQNHGFDPGNISRLERGVFAPPESDEKIAEYARALGLREGSDDWIVFFDRAAASRGHIPPDLHREENLVRRLPLLFRTLRGQKVSAETLDKVIELIRSSDSNGD
jgi:transcriptional regulator with XRE-family HTH domain